MKIVTKRIVYIMILLMALIMPTIILAQDETDTSENNIKVVYEYNDNTNQVIAKIVSEVELQDTKPTWDLSKDRKTYTKIYTKNEKYSTQVTDINGNVTNVEIDVTQVKDTEIKVDYIYNEETNQVIAIMTSNTQLQDTKPTWDLSEDKKIYTKIYTKNEAYSTQVTDINGTIINVELNITQVKDTEIKVNYEYDKDTNKVTAVIISNTILQDTKPTWILSKDKKTYTKVYLENENYTTDVVDINGKVITVNIKIEDIIETIINVDYKYDDVTNQVIATMTSSIELQDTKPTWKLSEDKKTYTKVFTNNQTYSTEVTNMYGYVVNVNISITQIDEKAPEVTLLEYTHNDDNTVTVKINANEKLKKSKGSNWKLSEDQMVYTRIFNGDLDYTTEIQDLYGHGTTVHIKIKRRIDQFPGTPNIKVKYMYTSYEAVAVEIVSDIQLQDTKPTWSLSNGKYRYRKQYTQYDAYSTQIVDIYGHSRNIDIKVDYFPKIIKCEEGTYGLSGLYYVGDPRSSTLKYYKIGDGPNVFFATFSVHGWEDLYNNDGLALTIIADNFKNKLIEMQDLELDSKWTIYIFPTVNPDGAWYGSSHNGPGRTTLTSQAPTRQGIDLNRCWQIGSSYTRYTSSRNYNGTTGFQAVEASSLRDFLINHRATNGQTVLVDLHGWLNETIGDNGLGSFYRAQYGISKHISSYGTGYLINWARSTLGARSVLVELPEWNSNSTSYINATLNMLRSI